VILTGQLGNASVSWTGNGSALLALLQGYPATALRLFLHAEPNPWRTLKRQVLKPLLTPGLRAFRRFKTPRSRPWQAYSALNIHMASELDWMAGCGRKGMIQRLPFLPGRYSPPLFLACLEHRVGIWPERAAQQSISILDPTFNQSMVEFLLRVPTTNFAIRAKAVGCFGGPSKIAFRAGAERRAERAPGRGCGL